jgi:dipeptidyl aminopeptidase/acylaminoacyl peptidase
LIFSTPGEIQKVDVNGGSARTIARVEGTAFATAESRFGVVLAAYFNSPLQIVRTPGGPAEPIAALDTTKNEVEHQAPVFLPDGRRFFYGSMRLGQLTLVTCLRSTDGSGATQELGGFAGRIVWAGSDVVLFVRGTDLLAQGIGYDPLRLLGEPVSLASNLAPFTPNNRAPTVAASDRVVAYRTDQPQLNQLSWVARDGRLLGVIGPEGQYPTFDLSADGANVAVARREQAAMNIWLLDALKGTMMNRVTAGPRLYVDPRLAPDGRSVIFGSMADPTRSPHRAAVTGEEPQLVFAHRGRMFSNDDWSGDGQWLLYHDASVPVLHAARIDRPGDPPVIVAKALTGTIDQAEFSSDGRRVAYNSSESGRNEVYVVPFPPTGERWQISTSGGVQPRWRRDGRELYYLGPDRSLMAVAIKTAPSFSAGDPIRLFESRLSTLSFQTEQYAAGPDGSRFLFALPVAGAKPEPVTVLTNWMSLVSASAAAR